MFDIPRLPATGANSGDNSVGHGVPELVLEFDGRTWTLDPSRSYALGRDPQGEVVFDDARVSWRHATVRFDGRTWVVEDHGSTNEGYVLGLYQDVLDRTPTPDEVAVWVTLLNDGASRNAVATVFLNSVEYRTELITSYYETFLQRTPDPGGLAVWLTAFQLGAKDQEVLAAIFGSPEGYALWS